VEYTEVFDIHKERAFVVAGERFAYIDRLSYIR
jgi:hypothetical protein